MSIHYAFPSSLCHPLIGLIDHASRYIDDCWTSPQQITPTVRFALASILATGPECIHTLKAQLTEEGAAVQSMITLEAPSPFLLPAIVALGTEAISAQTSRLDKDCSAVHSHLRDVAPAIREIVSQQTPAEPLQVA